MTIKQYLDGLRELPHKSADESTIAEVMEETTHIWDNDACVGYAIIAMRDAGFGLEEQARVIQAMRTAFDAITVDDASSFACEHPYGEKLEP